MKCIQSWMLSISTRFKRDDLVAKDYVLKNHVSSIPEAESHTKIMQMLHFWKLKQAQSFKLLIHKSALSKTSRSLSSNYKVAFTTRTPNNIDSGYQNLERFFHRQHLDHRVCSCDSLSSQQKRQNEHLIDSQLLLSEKKSERNNESKRKRL